MEIIESDSYANAWFQAVTLLKSHKNGPIYDLSLHINKPFETDSADDSVLKLVDEFLTSHGEQSLHTVAETIFPLSMYDPKTKDPSPIYETYPNETYKKIMKRSDRSWGRYAYRLVRREDPSGKIMAAPAGRVDAGEEINPLKATISKMQKYGPRDAKLRRNQIYELELADANYDLSLYNSERDRHRNGQIPCLSHLSFKIKNGEGGSPPSLNLTALYRSHYYMEKALGNFIGLTRLLFFVCDQTGFLPGTLTCHSTYATLDNVGNSEALLKSIEELYQDSEHERIEWKRFVGGVECEAAT